MFSNRALKKLLIPLVIEQILAMLVGMTDTLMVSSAGEAAVSGVEGVDLFGRGPGDIRGADQLPPLPLALV